MVTTGLVLIGMFGSVGSLPTNAQTATPVAEVSPTIAPISPPQPCVFIASSVEGFPIGEAIALDLQFVAEVTIWDQGVFPLSEGTLPALDAVADESDFAIVVLTADDLTTRRGQTHPVPRDNVLFEPGFFMGRLGVERTTWSPTATTPRPFPAISPGSPRPPLRNVRTGISLRQSVRHPRRSGKPCRG